MKQIKNYILIDLDWINQQISEISNYTYATQNIHTEGVNDGKLDLLVKLKEIGINAEILANKAYEAGKLDKELSLSFDNPKGRFLNQNIEL